jgi:FMN phosphatase YigB (HAD superfamily)
VLTNCDDAAFEAVHRTFRHPFDLFVTSERLRGFKPELWHFRAFKLLAQVQKDNWVHVASDWEARHRAAESFGIQRVWLDRPAGADRRGPLRTCTTASEGQGSGLAVQDERS